MGKWCFLPYDFDTGLGINNEGSLVFGYELEDIDQVAGADVYNGQHSVLWTNLRQAYFEEIKAMYQDLRSKGKLSYEDTERRFEEHQARWPEAIFNEDAFFKYLQPLIEDNSAAYLSMLQGSKAEQRKWWLYNRYRYLDSKYNAGDALSDVITVRGYAKADITVTPYADIYASVKYGSYLVQQRALRGNSYTLQCPLDNVNDTEIYIYSASQLKDVGDLSGLMVGYAEFALATKLQSLKLGDAVESYSNTNLTDLHLGNNVLLRTLDVRNCPNLTQAVDVSGCTNLEHVYFDGTSITGLLLPVGGILKTLHLPATITNLTIRNQASLTDLTIPSYTGISTLRLENVSSAVDSKAILQAIPANSRVRLIGIDWTAGTADKLMEIIALLDTMRGLDESGNNTDMAQVSGSISVDTVTGAQLAEITSKYPDIKVAYQHVTSNLYFYNEDGSTLLYTQAIVDGGNGTYSGSTPTKTSTAQYTYSFAGWSKKPGGAADSTALQAVTADRSVYAAFTATVRKYTVYFYNGSTLLQRVDNVPYGGSATYTGDTPVKTGADDPELYEFTGWQPTGQNITGNTNCYAQYDYLGAPKLKTNWKSAMTYAEYGTVTEVNFVDSYVPTGNEEKVWDASYYGNGSVMAYKTGTLITIAGDGSGVIMAPSSCVDLFSGFKKIEVFNGLSLLDISDVTNMKSMFYSCESLSSLDLSNFNTDKVTNMASLFAYCKNLSDINLTGWNTKNVVDMSYMFARTAIISIDFTIFNTENVTSFVGLLSNCIRLNSVRFNGVDFRKAINIRSMFADCLELATVDLTEIIPPIEAVGMDDMFYSCIKLTSIKLPKMKANNINTSFRDCNSLTDINITNLDTSEITELNRTFSGCSSLKSIDISKLDTSNVTKMYEPFAGCTGFTYDDYISLLLSLNITKVTMFTGMFAMHNYTYVDLSDLTTLNTSNVTDMSNMFLNCRALSSVTLIGLNTSNVTNMSNMFGGCPKLSVVDFAGLDTGNVTNMSNMFNSHELLETVDLSGIDMSNVTNLNSMFLTGSKCSLKNVNFPSTVKSIVSLNRTFMNCNTLDDLDLSDWDTSNLEDVYAFYNFEAKKLNLSGWDVSKVTNYSGAFKNCKINGTLVTRDNLREWNWNTGNLTEEQIAKMFG